MKKYQVRKSSNSPFAEEGQKPMAVSYRDAGKALGVCDRKVWDLVKSGQLYAVRIGRSVRIPVAELERFLEAK